MNSVLRFETHSEEETRETGRRLAAILPESGIVLLTGELGTGKTTLTKGIVEGRGAAGADDVRSPTFTLIHEYGQPVTVYHVDLYRLDEKKQAARLGLEELFERPALVLIEWGERFPDLFPANRSEIRIRHLSGDGRAFEVCL